MTRPTTSLSHPKISHGRAYVESGRQASSQRRSGVIGLFASVAIAAGLLFAAAPASASVYLGGVDMQRACNTQYQGFGLQAVVRDQRNAFSWRCAAPWDNSSYGIDVNRECVTQYGYGANAGLGSTSNPYSWYCKR